MKSAPAATGLLLALLTGTASVSHAQQTPAAPPPPSTGTTPPAAGTTTPAPLPPPPSWDVLKAAYDYDARAPLNVTEDRPVVDGATLRIHLTFTDAKGQKVTGLFLRPRQRGVYPVVLMLHGRGGSKDRILAGFGKPLTERGRVACLALDAALHGEREEAGKNPAENAALADILRTTVLDYRQALDYLATRKDVDTKRIGLFGYSMGAMTGAILTGVDTRVSAATLCVGGDPIRPLLAAVPAAMRPIGESAAPSNFIGHAAPRPVYLINGTKDTTITPEAARRMQDAAKNPKTIVWVESGHMLPGEDVRKGLIWLLDKLGIAPPTDSASSAPAAKP